jgi:hypothetical protein
MGMACLIVNSSKTRKILPPYLFNIRLGVKENLNIQEVVASQNDEVEINELSHQAIPSNSEPRCIRRNYSEFVIVINFMLESIDVIFVS